MPIETGNGGWDALKTQNPQTQTNMTPEDAENVLAQWGSEVTATPKTKQTVTSISPDLIDTTGRYPVQFVNQNNEELYGQSQSNWNKMGNGLLKGLAITGTTFLQSTVGLVNGAYKAIADGKFSSFYDNDFNRSLDKFSEEAENALPNYYTQQEQNAAWYSPSRLFTANFLWDKLVKNLGFAAGAALSGGVYSKALQGVSQAAKLFSVGKAAETVAASEANIAAAAAKGEQLNQLGKVGELSNKYLSSYQTLSTGQRATVAGLSSIGEASMEAQQNLNQSRSQMIQDYIDQNGVEPQGQDLQEINQKADSVGNSSFLWNVGLLTATNYIQFPRILGSSTKIDRALADTFGEIDNIRFNPDTHAYEAIGKTTRAGKIISKIGKTSRFLFSPSEAFEEGAQNAIQVGTQDYYTKKNNGDGLAVLSSIAEGVRQTLGSDSGMEQILIGGLSGGLHEGPIGYFTNRQDGQPGGIVGERRAQAARTQAAISGLNMYSSNRFMKETADAVSRGVQLQKDREEALKSGDVLESKDLEADYVINYLTPRVKFGRTDLVQSELDDYRSQAQTEEGFASLQQLGVASPEDNRQDFLQRLDNTQKLATSLASQYRSVTSRYSNQTKVDPKTGEVYKPYTHDVINQMIYASTKVVDYDGRMQQLSQELTLGGIDPTALVDGDLSDENIDQVMNQISGLPSANVDEKEDLASSARDLAELSQRRKLFLAEYQDLKDNPEKYRDVPKTAGSTEEVIDINHTEVTPGTTLTIGDTTTIEEDGTVSNKSSKITINGANEDGTINITDETGTNKDLTKEELSQYDIVDPTVLTDNKKFYIANAGEEYTLRQGDQYLKGKLAYDNVSDTLSFQYVQDRNKVRLPLSKGMFLGESPIVQSITDLSQERQTALSEFNSAPTQEIDENVFNVLSQVVDNYAKELKQVQDRIIKRNESLQKSKDALNKVKEAINKARGRNQSSIKGKALLDGHLKTASKLVDLQGEVEQELAELSSRSNKLKFNIEYVNSMLETGDTYSIFANNLKEQANKLDDILVENAVKTNALMELRGNIETALTHARDFLRHIVSLFRRKYNNSPEFYSKELLDQLATQTNFLQDNQDFRNDLDAVRQIQQELTDVDITPSEKQLDQITNDINNLQAELRGIEQIYEPTKDIVDAINGYVATIQGINDTVLDEQIAEQPEIIIGTPLKQEELFEASVDSRDDSKKRLSELPNSTTQNNQTTPAQKRHARLLDNLDTVPDAENYRRITVTKFNEAYLGLTGLSALQKGNYQVIDENDEPILAVYAKIVDGKEVFVDEKGEPLAYLGEENIPLDKLVYATLTNQDINDRNGNPRYAEKSGTEADAKRVMEGWAKERTRLLAMTNTFDSQKFNVSRGRPLIDQKAKSVTENLAPNDIIKQEKVLFVSKAKLMVEVAGHKVPFFRGEAFFHRGNRAETLQINKFSKANREHIIDLIDKMAKKFVTTKELDRDISHYLSGILYWHVSANNKPSKNQIYVNNGRLYFGKNSVSFTPTGISKGKSELNTFLKETYHNINTGKLEANDPFREIKPDGSVKAWDTYQEYLLSGEGRQGDEIPVYTTIVPGDLIYKNRYSYVAGTETKSIPDYQAAKFIATKSDEPEVDINECNI